MDADKDTYDPRALAIVKAIEQRLGPIASQEKRQELLAKWDYEVRDLDAKNAERRAQEKAKRDAERAIAKAQKERAKLKLEELKDDADVPWFHKSRRGADDYR